MDNSMSFRIYKTVIHNKVSNYELGKLTEIVRNFCGLDSFEVYYGVLKKYVLNTAILDLVDESTTILVKTTGVSYFHFEDHMRSRFSNWDIDFDAKD